MAQNGLQKWKKHHIHHHIRGFWEKNTDIFEKNMDFFEKNTDICLKNRGYGEKKHGYFENIHGYEKSTDIFLNIHGLIPISTDI